MPPVISTKATTSEVAAHDCSLKLAVVRTWLHNASKLGGAMKTKIALTVLIMLAACTTISDVTPAGDGHYTVTTQVRGGMTPWGEVKATSLKRADEYCSSQGKQMHQVDMQTHGVRGWTPQEAELTFACASAQ
ncbi:hypothetical protein [Paraburkholderia sediminicola]|uniref:hypothetical protein n=2 Tax=Burkholderiaceae TaxID=119060 RepID=UPI0038B7AB03